MQRLFTRVESLRQAWGRAQLRRGAVLGTLLLLAAQVAGAQSLTVLDQARAKEIAAQRGWWTRHVDPRGRVLELQKIVNGMPRYYMTDNRNAADSVSTDECWPGGAGGLSLTGSGITLGIWDSGKVFTTHVEFDTRAIQKDSPSQYSDHSTHVSGTMIAAGRWTGYPPERSKGMSPQATLHCYDWNDDLTEMRSAAGAGLRVSNHSYGYSAGWELLDEWYWFGDVLVSQTEDYFFGRYSTESRDLDLVACDYPYYLIVRSGGNDRSDTGPGPGGGHYYWNPTLGNWEWSTTTRDPDGPYDCMENAAIAKNVLTVGAVRDVVGGYGGPGSVAMTSFSSWGPADDGRIRPDLIGNGYELLSCILNNQWGIGSGTSMSAPNVSGSLGLLVQHWRDTHPAQDDMRSSTLKALIIHTADECGSASGPDYSYGWGLLNTLRAAETITANTNQPMTITEHELTTGGEVVVPITADPAAPELRATICWTDPPGTPPAHTPNNPAKMLVNDLDLRIEAPGGTIYSPWVLDPATPSAAATNGDNDTDNVEQIVIPSPGAGSYTLKVTHKGSLLGITQVFSLILTGQIHLQIITHPADATVCTGQAATFTVEAAGTGTLSYQWRKDGQAIPGATQPSLTIDPVGPGDAGVYDVEVTDSTGTITSNPATLTVVEGSPSIVTPPVGQSLCVGGVVTFTVEASGGEPLLCQWRKNGWVIPGAVGRSYTIDPVTFDDAGAYDVVVSNACGSVTSSVAVLTVLDCSPPGAPMSPSPAHGAAGVSADVNLTWGAVPRATSYDVYFGTSPKPPLQGSTEVGAWVLEQLDYSTTYYWKLLAKNGFGATQGPVWSFTTRAAPIVAPGVPSSPYPPDGAIEVPLDAVLDWDDVSGDPHYLVLFDTVPEQPFRFRGATLSSSWYRINLVEGTTYYWQVVAQNDAGSRPGPIWSFTTVQPPEPPSQPAQDTQPKPQVPDTGPEESTPPDESTGEDQAEEPTTEFESLAGTGLCPAAGTAMLLLTMLGLWGTRPGVKRRQPSRKR